MIELENKFMKLTEDELEKQLEGIWEFIKKIHPELRSSKYINKLNEINITSSDLCVELRALRRDINGNPMYCNHRVYNYGDKQKQLLKNFLKKLNDKEIPYCLYYSVYCFNSNVLAISQSGNVAKEWNNRIALNNAIGTHILIWDFDHINEDEFIQIKCKLLNIGLETLDIFTGHGYQSIILLDNLELDKDLLKEFTVAIWERGFDVDLKIKDCARIMRKPYCFNSKDILNGGEMILTNIYSDTNKRYTLEEVRSLLNSVPKFRESKTTIPKIKNESKEEIKVEDKSMNTIKIVKLTNELNKNRLNDNELEELYPMLNIKEFPNAIKLMLSGFQNGYANNVLMFITLYLKENGYALSIINDVINILKGLNTYNYSWLDMPNSEVNRFYFMNDYTSQSVFLSELNDFGYVEYNFIDKSVITVNNYVFSKLADMSSSAFYIYIKLLEKQNYDNTGVFTLNEISEIVGISRRSIIKHIDDLVKSKLLDKKRANRRHGEEYKFFLSRFEQHKEFGFTKFNIATLKLLLTYVSLKKITTTQLCICMYIKYICYNGKQNCIISQENLGLALGISQSGISKSFKNIEDVMLIRRDEVKINDFQFKYNYTIHY